jgi:hypothetical protein
MPWLPIYCNESDQQEILSYLNEHEEIAFIVSDGPGRWIATRRIESLEPETYCLWHIPSGPLPLLRGLMDTPGEIVNPFDGWTEIRPGADASLPYFGPANPGVIWLNIHGMKTDKLSGAPLVGLSSFGWIGNHYRIIGIPAKIETETFWKMLRKWTRKQARLVPRGGPGKLVRPEIWAFRGASDMFENGIEGAINP